MLCCYDKDCQTVYLLLCVQNASVTRRAVRATYVVRLTDSVRVNRTCSLSTAATANLSTSDFTPAKDARVSSVHFHCIPLLTSSELLKD